MNCRKCQEAIFEYVDGTLTQDLRQAVDAHLAHCAECAATLGNERQAMDRMSFLLKPAAASFCLTPSFQAHILETALSSVACHEHRIQKTLFSWIRPLAAAAAIVLLIAGVSSRQWLSQPAATRTTNSFAAVSDNNPATNESCRLIPLASFSNNLDLCDGL